MFELKIDKFIETLSFGITHFLILIHIQRFQKMKKSRPSTASDRANFTIKEEAKRKLQNCSDPVEKLRCFCLTRGATGILGLGR